MIRWTISLALGLAVAWLAYGQTGRSERSRALLLGLLRAAAVALVAALLVGAPSAPARPASPLIALDVSASWRRGMGDDSAAVQALRKAAVATAGSSDQLVFVGDSLREVSATELAHAMPQHPVGLGLCRAMNGDARYR